MKIHLRLTIWCALIIFLTSSGRRELEAADYELMRQKVLELSQLTVAPETYPAAEFKEDGQIRPLFYRSLDYQGKPTRTFAWLGVPEVKPGSQVPGVVLVHGGGGTAFKEWVAKWNEKGFATISIAVEGQTSEANETASRGHRWSQHQWAGPQRAGIYQDSGRPLAEQWIYHAVADTILANSLLRSLAEVDETRVGLMGISWGGVVTSTVMGIDQRFAFAIPTYGCGDLADVENQYGRALGENGVYRNVWDPLVRMKRAKMPSLWLSWTGDKHFPLDSLKSCYDSMSGPYMVALVPNMGHSHGAGWNPPDSYAFAKSVIENRRPWGGQRDLSTDGNHITAEFYSDRPIDRAILTYTEDSGFTGDRQWHNIEADFVQTGEKVTVEARLPDGATAWFLNLFSDKLTLSSDYQTSEDAIE